MEQSPIPRTLIIGASGFLGSQFYNNYHALRQDTAGTSRHPTGTQHYLDLTNSTNLEDAYLQSLTKNGYAQALLIAGIPQITRCEENPTETHHINVDAIVKIATYLHQHNIKPIFFSTDYVFDGQKKYPERYTEQDAPTPQTHYGMQKYAAEQAIMQATAGNCLIIRFSKIYSTKQDKSLIDEIMRTLYTGKKYAAATDQWFTPTHIDDSIAGVQFLQSIDAQGIYHLAAPESMSRYELARKIAIELGLDAAQVVTPITLENLQTAMKRPKNTSLDCTKFFQAYAQNHPNAQNQGGMTTVSHAIKIIKEKFYKSESTREQFDRQYGAQK